MALKFILINKLKLKFQNLEFVLKNKMEVSILGKPSFTWIIKHSLYNGSS